MSFLSGRTSLTTVNTGDIADDAVTLPKMAHGTDGNIITYDASGAPAAVATGSAGDVLISGASTNDELDALWSSELPERA